MIYRLVFAILVLLASPWAPACTIVGLVHEVKFERASTAPSASEIRKLVAWYVEKRDGPQGISDAYVAATWPEADLTEERIARARMRSIFDLVTLLGKNRSIPLQVIGASVVETGPRRPEDFLTVRVGTQPLCAKTKSCCGQ